MSYVLNYQEYSHRLLVDDENTVKSALQEIFEALVIGATFPRTRRDAFRVLLSKHIVSPSTKVRKWAYHCACFYSNDTIYKNIILQLQRETVVENIMWALTALSIKYDNLYSLQKCAGSRHDEFLSTISENYLADALYLFGGVININPQTILLTNNPADLAALTKIYGYRNLVQGKYPTVTESIIQEIKNHPDEYVREYAYWSLFLGGSNESHLLESDDQIADVRKFQIALQIQNGDRDFIVSTLKPLRRCPSIIPRDIKNGVLLGMKRIAYASDYVPYIGGWFCDEEDLSICYLLLDYMIAHCDSNRDEGTFFDIIKDSLNEESFAEYVVDKIKGNLSYSLSVMDSDSGYILDFSKKEHNTMLYTVTDKRTIIHGDGTIFAGEKSTITTGDNSPITTGDNSPITTGDNSPIGKAPSQDSEVSLEDILAEIKRMAQSCPEKNDPEAVDEYVDTISEQVNSEKPKKKVIGQMIAGLKAIKGTADFVVAVTKLVDFFKDFV